MNKDEIFIDGIRKYICVGYSETERPIYELSPEYEKYIREKEKSPQNLPKANAYSLLAEVLELETEDFHTEEDWVRREDVLKLLSKHLA